MTASLLAGMTEEIDAKRIRPSAQALREELGNIDELLLSIVQSGLLQPVVVRPVKGQNLFEVVAGNRRFQACRRLGIRKVPCYIMELDDKEAFETSITENLQRKTLSPMEEARAFQKYVDEYGYGSETELAKRIGKSLSYVSRRVALLKLSPHLQGLLRGASVGLAQELVSLDDEGKLAVANLIAQNRISTRNEVRRVARLIKDGEAIGLGHEAAVSFYDQETRERSLVRAVARFITLLEVCLMNLGEVFETLDEDEWIIRDALAQHRNAIHDQINSLMKLKRRIKTQLPPSDPITSCNANARSNASS